jgi:acetyl esterase/lipase
MSKTSTWTRTAIVTCMFLSVGVSLAQEPAKLDVWPDLAPNETSRDTGTSLPSKGEAKPIDRVSGVRRPTLDVYPAKSNPSGTAVIILPGGGFSYVVPDLEGSEAAEWLNQIGITAFVLRYRTKEAAAPGEALWQRPLQDAQRALRLVRSNAEQWKLNPDRLGVLGFSAGGQVASILHTSGNKAAYESVDEIDKRSFKPAFSLLIYPWQVIDAKGELLEPIKVTDQSPPAFIVHTHDDASSAIGAAKIYIELKKNNVSAELHVYQNGGHGYGVRERPNSVISSWPARATEWFKVRGLLDSPK